RTGGILNVTGKLDLQGQTLTLDTARGPWILIGGTIQNGTITQTGTGKLLFTAGAFNTLDNVTVNGDLDVTSPNAFLHVKNGLVLDGVLRIDNSAAVGFEGTQTFATGTVEFTGDSGTLGLDEDAALTLGPNVIVHG